jgi:uncharacterized protein
MLLGILSDTHDRLDRTRAAVELLRAEGAEALIHCGDLTVPEIVPICAVLPCYFVFGNNDEPTELQEAMADAGAVCLGWGGEVKLGGRRIAVTHGHLSSDERRLLAVRPDYLLYGHSHVADERRDGPTLRINPGALHRASQFTVALLDLATDHLRFLSIPR